ncbi:hypothetical protein D3C81_2241770 [compost metagenome]
MRQIADQAFAELLLFMFPAPAVIEFVNHMVKGLLQASDFIGPAQRDTDGQSVRSGSGHAGFQPKQAFADVAKE